MEAAARPKAAVAFPFSSAFPRVLYGCGAVPRGFGLSAATLFQPRKSPAWRLMQQRVAFCSLMSAWLCKGSCWVITPLAART